MSEPRIEVRTRLALATAMPATAGWKCTAHFMGCIAQPSEETMSRYLPVERMAHLPEGGGLACVLVACRVEDVDLPGKAMRIGVRIASPIWHDELESWVESILLQSLERSFVAAANVEVQAVGDNPAYTVDMPPTYGSELEVAAYFAKGMVESPEEFVKTLGVLVNVRCEYLAEIRRITERESARAERLRIYQAQKAVKEAAAAQKPWGRLKWGLTCIASPFVWFVNWVFPPVKPAVRAIAPSVQSDPKDPWAERSELFSMAFLSACELNMGSLLRRVTTYSPIISAFLAREGVMVGETATMVEHMRKVMQVTRVDTHTGSGSAIFDVARDDGLEDGVALPEARIEPPLNLHEVRFTPRGPQHK